jgi:hypothetical protein
MFVYSSHVKWVFPPLLWSFPLSATLTSFPAPGCWAHAPGPARASPARPSLFIYSTRKDSLPPIFGSQCTPPSFLRVFIVLIAYYSVSLFSPGGGQSVQEAMLIWPRVVCGSTMYRLAHLVHVFPSHLGMGVWQPGNPPGFSIQREVEILCTGWRYGRVKFCLFSVALPARCISSVSPRFHFRRYTFCFLPLAAILESPRSSVFRHTP